MREYKKIFAEEKSWGIAHNPETKFVSGIYQERERRPRPERGERRPRPERGERRPRPERGERRPRPEHNAEQAEAPMDFSDALDKFDF